MQKASAALFQILLSIFLLAACTADAADPGGLIKGTIGDRDISIELDASQSDWYGDGNSGGVSMMSRPIAPKEGLGRISIGFEGSDFRAGRFSNFEVDLGVVGAPGVSYGATVDEGLEVTLDRIEVQGDVLQLEGRVRGTLVRQEPSRGTREPGDTREIELNFAIQIDNHY